MNYYNEFDEKTAAWLRELINQKLIPQGYVDTRSITEVTPSDLKGFTQCHFFAGIGGWSLALQLAGWPEDQPVWTGSCPCQPFSVAGKGRGTEDERHLWPVFAELIRACKPSVVFGEQVASKAGREWLAGVFAGLEGMAYQRAGADLCAASKAAPHVRQRLFWVAHADGQQHFGIERPCCGGKSSIPSIWESEEIFQKGQGGVDELVSRCITKRVSSYSEARSILHGLPARVGILRGAGNAIVPQVAAEFVGAYLDCLQEDWI
jgi:DNA (cytosine-5)-methyltransferase 1